MTRSATHALAFARGSDLVLTRISQAIVFITIAVLLTSLTVNVTLRYALGGGGRSWLSELPEHFFPWMVAAGVVLAAVQSAHIAVDILLHGLNPRAGRLLAIAIQLGVAATYVVLGFVAVRVSQIVAIEYSALLNISRRWAYYALVFMSAGVSLASLSLALRVALNGMSEMAMPDPEDSPV